MPHAPPTCSACGSSGHTMRSKRCPARSQQAGYRRALRSPTSVHDHAQQDIGGMTETCAHCEARLWKVERSSGRATYLICCHHGRVLLPPRPPLPALLHQLINRSHADSGIFLRHVRAFNVNLAFTSIGVREERSLGEGPPYYIISGALHHLMGTLLPEPNHEARFAQVYLFDAQEQLVARSARLMRVCRDRSLRLTGLLDQLQAMLLECNPYARTLLHARDIMAQDDTAELHIRLLAARDGQHTRTHNTPTVTDEMAVILPGHGGDGEPNERDVLIKQRGGQLRRVHTCHPAYNALQYPLLFPHGEDGWHERIPLRVFAGRTATDTGQHDTEAYSDSDRPNRRQFVTLLQHASYSLMVRPASSLHRFGRLFLQYVVDSYARIEQQRLSFLRAHQRELRAEVYGGIADAIAADGTVSYTTLGRRVILPSSFLGSPRHMQQQYQDAMAIIRHHGKPDLFITMTCNPEWPEIIRELEDGQRASDRPDLIARVFHAKLDAVMKEIREERIFGTCVAHVYVIEFQKRGLPHAHILLILDDLDKPRTPDDYDAFVCAEIPNQLSDAALFRTVTRSMIHTCSSRCRDEHGKCSRGYPKPIQDVTEDNDDGYPLYRRRRDGVSFVRNGRVCTNMDVVPYNPYLCRKYDCHINVEICSSVKSVKYLFKYVHKGHDMTNLRVDRDEDAPVDEISDYVEARYISQCEAAYRIFQFKMHDRSPAVIRLGVHEENMQNVYMDESTTLDSLAPPDTTLTAYFRLNREDEHARTFLYHELPAHYSYDKKARRWKRRARTQRAATVGRMYFVSPTDTERFCLRLLLTHVRGARSFEELRTVQGAVRPNFQAACLALGLLQSDAEWHGCLEEASGFMVSAGQLRQLFSTILLFSCPASPLQLWTAFQDELAADYLHSGMPRGLSHRRALLEIDHRLGQGGKRLSNYPDLPQLAIDNPDDTSTEQNAFQPEEEETRFHRALPTLNADQSAVFNKVTAAIDRADATSPAVFFLDGPGGTGKTYIYNTLLAYVRGRGDVAIAVSSSGISAILLSGGRTAHSMFKIPLSDLNAESTCSVRLRSKAAKLIRQSKLLIWDEIGMMNRHAVEAVDRLYRDIMRVAQPGLERLPFGGKATILGGDFKQVLPVLPGATRRRIVGSTMPRSPLWSHIQVLRLTINMRVMRLLAAGHDPSAASAFADWILRVGDGTEITHTRGECTSYITLPPHLCIRATENHHVNIQSMVGATFPDFQSNYHDVDYLRDRAILSPTNKTADEINNHMLSMIPGEVTELRSVDTLNDSTQKSFGAWCPVEFLHTICPSGMPKHILRLKIGMPVLLMRNLSPLSGLCNGARMIVRDISDRVINCIIAVGPFEGSLVSIPRIKLQPSEMDFPFPFQRIQFPLQPAFAMTINKSQGQTLKHVGVFLPEPVFTHGQLYVALSRVGSEDGVRILAPFDISNGTFYTRNIVYREALLPPH